MNTEQMVTWIEDTIDVSNCRDVEWLTNYVFTHGASKTWTRTECTTFVRSVLSYF